MALTTWTYELRRPSRPVAPKRPRPKGLAIDVVRDPGLNRELYVRIGHDHGWTDRARWGPDAWTRHARRVETHVALVAGAVAGFAELEPGDQGACVAILGLVEGARGAGLGGHLLHHVLRRGLERADRVWLTTCSLDGEHARANYEARGMRLVGEVTTP